MTELDHFTRSPAAPAPSFIGQATAVEQSRAVAEVQAAVVVAQQRPRDTQAALREMREVTNLAAMADRAFFSYKRGGSPVTGATVHLARELARIWGNIQYGISELRRDDVGGFSEMQAVAWDLQTNARAAQTFVVPHKRDKGNDVVDLTSLRDVYENNANMGARRLRAQIFAVLPSWFTDEAIERCNTTLKHGGGVPLATRITNMTDRFRAELKVTVGQIETRLGRKASSWDEHDVASLAIVFKSIQTGSTSVDNEFPTPGLSADEVASTTTPRAPVDLGSAPEADPADGYDPTDDPASGWTGGSQA